MSINEEEPKNRCIYWGENRPDELFYDVGCVIGHAFCDPEKCEDFAEAEADGNTRNDEERQT